LADPKVQYYLKIFVVDKIVRISSKGSVTKGKIWAPVLVKMMPDNLLSLAVRFRW